VVSVNRDVEVLLAALDVIEIQASTQNLPLLVIAFVGLVPDETLVVIPTEVGDGLRSLVGKTVGRSDSEWRTADILELPGLVATCVDGEDDNLSVDGRTSSCEVHAQVIGRMEHLE